VRSVAPPARCIVAMRPVHRPHHTQHTQSHTHAPAVSRCAARQAPRAQRANSDQSVHAAHHIRSVREVTISHQITHKQAHTCCARIDNSALPAIIDADVCTQVNAITACTRTRTQAHHTHLALDSHRHMCLAERARRRRIAARCRRHRRAMSRYLHREPNTAQQPVHALVSVNAMPRINSHTMRQRARD
jgi:hypothetical protein